MYNRLYYVVVIKGDAMGCKHIWKPEDTNRWTCSKCSATKWIDGKSIVHYYDVDGKHLPNEDGDGEKDVLWVEQELEKLRKK